MIRWSYSTQPEQYEEYPNDPFAPFKKKIVRFSPAWQTPQPTTAVEFQSLLQLSRSRKS